MFIAQKIYAKQSGKYGKINIDWKRGFTISYVFDDLVIKGRLPVNEYYLLQASILVACYIFCVDNGLMWGCVPIVIDVSSEHFQHMRSKVFQVLKEIPDGQELFLLDEGGLFPAIFEFSYNKSYDRLIITNEEKRSAEIK